MTLATLQYNGVEKTLADWGIAACRRSVSNQAGDHLAFDVAAPCDEADPFPFGAQIILRLGRVPAATQSNGLPAPGVTAFSGGRIFFVGWRVDNFRAARPEVESLRYKFAGPWEFFLERLVFQKLFLTWNGSQQIADYRSQVVLGQSLTTLTGPTDTVPGTIATNLMSISQQIREIAGYCSAQTTAQYGSPQFQFDGLAQDGSGNWVLSATPGANCQLPDYIPGLGAGAGAGNSGNGLAPGQTAVPLRAPLDAVQDITCAEAIRRQLRWIGGVGSPVVWFDYTTSPPTLKIATRDQLPAVSLPAFGGATQGHGPKELSITRRDDLIPAAINFMYRVTTTVDGASYTQIYHDIATSNGNTNESTGVTDPALLAAGRQFGAQVVTLDFEGAKFTTQTAAITTIDLQLGGSVDSYACYKSIFPELLNISSITGGYDSITHPETGASIDPSPYPYILRDGGIAPWMYDGSTPGVAQRVLLGAHFAGIDPNGQVIANTRLNAHLTLCTIPGGTYSTTSESAGEGVPWGLATYAYNIEKIPQYQGSFLLQEFEITDACPIGSNLNLVGAPGPGAMEWATMNACVQQITYDLDAATTELVFGPAAHLGPQDLVERLRVNRYPRFYYQIGGDLLNA